MLVASLITTATLLPSSPANVGKGAPCLPLPRTPPRGKSAPGSDKRQSRGRGEHEGINRGGMRWADRPILFIADHFHVLSSGGEARQGSGVTGAGRQQVTPPHLHTCPVTHLWRQISLNKARIFKLPRRTFAILKGL
ncbi:uncharacterized protein LOC123498634 [Portunus trituberculatus]|uniref:uncharacterized protein LOC123498634 n=1 Tax=Portunus trituberculatus TaxID=210409 RepID=UPI001E1CF866|nr:uncharacterized protein LOC123498634 [Portunus trituberculatus]